MRASIDDESTSDMGAAYQAAIKQQEADKLKAIREEQEKLKKEIMDMKKNKNKGNDASDQDKSEGASYLEETRAKYLDKKKIVSKNKRGKPDESEVRSQHVIR